MNEPLWPAVLGRFGWMDLPFVRAWQDPSVQRDHRRRGRRPRGGGRPRRRDSHHLARPLALSWSEWFTTLDHKRIGVMYVVIAFVMLSRALVEAVLMRMQQAAAINSPASSRPITSRSSSPPTAAS